MLFVDSLKDALRPVVNRLRVKRNMLLHGGCAVLLYHRVIDLETDPQLLSVGPVNFDEHLRILKENYRVLSVAEFDEHMLNNKRFPERAVLLTFDDGYADNHLQARPILERHNLQALFYVSSGYMGSAREYWWDELERLLLVKSDLPAELKFDSHGIQLEWRSAAERNRVVMQASYDRLLEELRRLPYSDRDVVLGELCTALHSVEPRASHLPMTLDQLRAFASSPAVVIGAHSIGHSSLGYQSEEEQRREIFGSKTALESMLGITVPYFSYPFGTGADFNNTSLGLVEEAGFRHVSANYPGLVHGRSARFKFPRFLVRNWDGPEFRKQMQRFFNG